MINTSSLLRCAAAALALSAAATRADTALAPTAAPVNTTGAATPSEPVTGWVTSAQVSGKRTLAPDTELHESPDAASPVVRRFVVGDGLAVQKVSGPWTQVRLYPGAGGVVPAAAPAPAAAPTPAPAEAAATVSVASAPVAVESQPVVAVLQPPPPAAQPAAEAVAAPAAEVAPVAVTERAVKAPAVLPVRVFAGQLVETRGFIFTKPPADYELIDGEGYRIAFVDISRLLRTIDTERLLGRSVQVSGRVQAVRKGRDSLITAESLLLR